MQAVPIRAHFHRSSSGKEKRSAHGHSLRLHLRTKEPTVLELIVVDYLLVNCLLVDCLLLDQLTHGHARRDHRQHVLLVRHLNIE